MTFTLLSFWNYRRSFFNFLSSWTCFSFLSSTLYDPETSSGW